MKSWLETRVRSLNLMNEKGDRTDEVVARVRSLWVHIQLVIIS
ncbi:hypothetical protein [Anabaena azotica]